MAEHRGHRVLIVRVFAERVIVRNRFRLGINHEFVGIAAACFAVKRRPPLAKNLLQFFLRKGGDLLDRFNSQHSERALGDFANAGNLSNRKWRKKPFFTAGCNPEQTVRFGLIRRNFRYQPRPSQSAGTRQRRRACDGSKQLVGGGERWPVQAPGAREIEISLVNRNHLDGRRKLSEDGRNSVAPLRIFSVVAVKENGVRTQPPSRSKRHRGVNPEFPRFVTGGRNHAALVRPPADHHRPAAKLRPLEQFHRNEKRVHVHVQNARWLFVRSRFDRVVLGAESREVRHAPSLRCGLVRYNRSAARTRGIPARSLVTPTFVQTGASRSGWTAGRLLWPSSRTRIPAGWRCAAACAMRSG